MPRTSVIPAWSPRLITHSGRNASLSRRVGHRAQQMKYRSRISRLRKREFNQSLSFANPVAQHLDVPLLIDSLVQIKRPPPQTTLKWKDRRSNVCNVFSVRRPPDVENKELLLVADVLTTRSTVNESARMLCNAGAKLIHVLALTLTV